MTCSAGADAELRWRGFFESDVRLFLHDADVPFERLESTFGTRATAEFGDHVTAVADLELIFTERSQPQDFAGLTNRAMLDPWRIESDALFVEFTDVLFDGFDLRLGRQQLIWGTADRFHPTAHLNAFDFEDPLKFGEALANEMLSIRISPDVSLGDDDDPWFEELGLELVFVPVFKPAQLPQSAGLAFTDPEEMARQVTSPAVLDLLEAQKPLLGIYSFGYSPNVVLPDRNLANSMLGARLSWYLLGMDLSVSYFRGFDDFPRAEKVVATIDEQIDHVDSQITLSYPRIQVLGADMATSVDWLDGLGFWTEVGLVFHDDLFQVIDTPPPVEKKVVDREYKQGRFFKAVVGTDYTPAPWCYINVQYVHGFLDEFGTKNLDDYIVAGIDLKMARDKVLLRTFGIVNLQDESFVLFPQLVLTPWNNAEFQLGAFLFFGKKDSKFGSAASGESTAFMKGKVSF